MKLYTYRGAPNPRGVHRSLAKRGGEALADWHAASADATARQACG